MTPVRYGLLAALVACRGGAAPPDAGRETETKKAPPVDRPLAAVSGSIAQVAVTEDGIAAVTADDDHMMRLWPALDGTREPVVLRGPQPRSLAIAHDGDRLRIAIRDLAGGVSILTTQRDGTVIARAQLPIVARHVVVAGRAFVVLGEDRTIELAGFDGARQRLVPDPGTTIEGILARDGAALAVIRDRTVHGRWIDLAHGAWGESTGTLAIDPATAALAPGHKAVTSGGAVIDLALGKTLARADPWASPAGPPACVFADDRHLACVAAQQLMWLEDGKSVATHTATTAPIVAAGPGFVVTVMGSQLVLAEPKRVRYLGYGVADFAHFRSTPAGIVIGGGDHTGYLLDRKLAVAARIALPPAAVASDIVALDERRVIALVQLPEHSGTSIGLYERNALVATVATEVRDFALRFEPATNLLAYEDPSGVYAVHYDPATHAFGKPRRFEGSAGMRIDLLDPALAGGLVAIRSHRDGERVRIDELELAEAKRSYWLNGDLRAVDRAGRVYVAAGGEIVASKAGVVAARFHGTPTVYPSPDGELVALRGDNAIALADRGGTIRWQAPAWDVREVAWSSDGRLIARFVGSLVDLDLATGEPSQRHCGWEFALRDVATGSPIDRPPVCDMAP